MKFLCDRCKTRYSIGDDRVRGKILKIRCKNCANVITVREGMADVDAAADPAQPRRNKTTTAAPEVSSAVPANGALSNAFKVALTTKPPASLEEEWYVSIDGEQMGPYSLVDAQRWVASKAWESDLHCWSEGFDDWLPVDKVSHFRGLRKKPQPAVAPPPMPRVAQGGLRPVEEEPKPLFAATMASLEKSVPNAATSGRMPMPVAAPAAMPSAGTGPSAALNNGMRPSATPPGGERAMPMQARANGSAQPVKVPVAIPVGLGPSPASMKSGSGAVPSISTKPARSGPAPRAETKPGHGAKNAFDVGDPPTMIDSPAFDTDSVTSAEPITARSNAANDALVKGIGAAIGASARDAVETVPAASAYQDSITAPRPPAVAAQVANAPVADDLDDEGDLSIGEVSRVVKLADLMKSGAASAPKRAQAVPGTRTGSIPRLSATGAVPRISATGAVPRIDDPNVPAGLGANPLLADVPHDLAMSPAVQANHRRGLFILIGVAALLLAGVVVAVVLLVLNTDEGPGSTLRANNALDTTRPDDPLRKQAGSAVNPFLPPPPPDKVKPKRVGPGPGPGPGQVIKEELPTGPDRLGGDEVEAYARNQSGTTQRCYMRAQRGAEQFLTADVKKITVTLTVEPAGNVSSVNLSQHEQTGLGKCLTSAIRGWKLRASPKGGTFQISLVFANS